MCLLKIDITDPASAKTEYRDVAWIVVLPINSLACGNITGVAKTACAAIRIITSVALHHWQKCRRGGSCLDGFPELPVCVVILVGFQEVRAPLVDVEHRDNERL